MKIDNAPKSSEQTGVWFLQSAGEDQIITNRTSRDAVINTAIEAGHPGSHRLRAEMMKAIIAILCLAAIGAYAQQDIDLTGYRLVFSDEFNTLSVGSAQREGSCEMGRLAALWSRRSVQPFTLGKTAATGR